MEFVFQILYTITTALLIPVVTLLLVLLGWSLFQIGGFLAETRERRHTSPAGRWHETTPAFGKTSPTEILDPSRRLFDIELQMTRRLARLRWAVRVGPMLGLMGTLIPMGPALLQFSSGDFAAAAAQIVIAFGTTVVGLVVAGTAYTLWQIRKLWYAQDLADLEYELYHETTIDSAHSQTPTSPKIDSDKIDPDKIDSGVGEPGPSAASVG